MDKEAKLTHIMSGMENLTRKFARDYNVDADDVYQSLALQVWERIDRIDISTDRFRGLLKLQAKDIASNMRKSDMISRSNPEVTYCPNDIRAALKRGALLPDSRHPMRADLIKALNLFKEEDRRIIFRNYVLNERINKQESNRMYYVIDRVSDILNGYKKGPDDV